MRIKVRVRRYRRLRLPAYSPMAWMRSTMYSVLWLLGVVVVAVAVSGVWCYRMAVRVLNSRVA